MQGNTTQYTKFTLIMGTVASSLVLLITALFQFGGQNYFSNLANETMTSISEGTIALDQLSTVVEDYMTKLDMYQYVLYGITWLAILLVSYVIIITLVKLVLKNTKWSKTFGQTIAQLFNSKHIGNTILYVIGSFIVTIILISFFFLEIKVIEVITSSITTDGSALISFTLNALITIIRFFVFILNVYLVTSFLFTFVSKFFKKQYGQNLKAATVNRRARKTTTTMALVAIVVYVAFFVPNYVISNSTSDAVYEIALFLNYVVMFVLSISFMAIAPTKFTGRYAKLDEVEEENTNEEKDFSPIYSYDKSSRSRRYGYTKNQTVKGSRIERTRRKLK